VGARLTAPPAGVILAGGRASRLGGASKGLCVIGGTRIIDRVAAALAPSVSRIAVSANSSSAKDWIDGAEVIEDILQGGGSAAGIHAALRWANGPVVAVAWDMPFIDATAIATVANHARDGDFDAVVPAGERADTFEPLCGWYASRFADVIERHWHSGERSLHTLLRDMRVCIVPRNEFSDAGRLFFNVNSPGDLARAESLLASGA
jgi:molybdopterin-guanine dinucleotide biosynthesis protein A